MRRKPLKRIGIFGVAGFNRGDDAISASLIRGFHRIRPDIQFIVPLISKQNTKVETGVETFSLDRRSALGIARLFYNVWRSDAVILGGGSLIQDQLGGSRLRGVLGYTWMVSAFSKLLGRPLATAPLGVDRLSTEKGKLAGCESLHRFGLITVRDALSAEVAIELAGQSISNRLQVVCDPVFDYDVLDVEEVNLFGTDYYVLAPAFEGRNEERIVAVFSSVVAELAIRFPSAKFVIIAMDERVKEDHGRIQLIQDNLDVALKHRVMLFTPSNPDSAAQVLRRSKGVIAMRLHALILAFGYAPVFCLSRTTKTEGLMADYKIPGVVLRENSNFGEIARHAADAVSNTDISGHQLHSTRLKENLKTYYQDVLDYFTS